ncbi:uncharacterized protein METZ01_LOCUS516285 [marine metagenome]|uniref:Uncharacterized protein n=1 Tax=marine metagenome TaxID=408172 RepID=A0A383F372_9ZZZZ
MAKLTEVNNAFDGLSGEEKIVADWAYEYSKTNIPEENVEGYYKAKIGTEPTVHLISLIIRGLPHLTQVEPKINLDIISDDWIYSYSSSVFADKLFEFSPEKDLEITEGEK